jgi:heat shock protein HtpX
VSYRVQCAGTISLVVIPLILVLIVVVLFSVSVGLGLAIVLAFILGLQIAIAKTWTSARPRPASVADAPNLHAVVERLCAESGLVKPRIVIHDAGYANSWVKGLFRKHVTLHLTTGLLERLDGQQLEAVIAHELAHIGQKDSGLMSAVGTPVEAMLSGAEFYFHWYRVLVVSGAKDWRQTPPTFVLYGFLGMLLLLRYWLPRPWRHCRAVTALFSRMRELEADAGAARLTGNPAALASALIAISGTTNTIPVKDLRQAASLDVFHILAMGKERPLFGTHPSLKRRLAALNKMEHRLQHAHG